MLIYFLMTEKEAISVANQLGKAGISIDYRPTRKMYSILIENIVQWKTVGSIFAANNIIAHST